MKKTVVLIAALMSCCLAYSQEANSETSETYGEITVIPRLDLDANVAFGDKPYFDFGTSSLYTLFEGEFAEHFSFSVCNHWLSTDPGSLYKNTFHTDDLTWLDWATITGQFGNFFFTAGKDVLAVATSENWANDYDSHYQMNTYLWNCLQTYQWGARAGWASTDGNSQAGIQFTTSPFGEKINSGLFTFTAFGNHDFENASIMASATLIPTYFTGERLMLYALSGSYSFGDVKPGLDVFYQHTFSGKPNPDFPIESMSLRHFGAVASCEAQFNEKLGMLGKVTYERIDAVNRFTAGAALYYYPISGSSDLRLHGMVAFNDGLVSDEPRETATSLSFSIGATYFLKLTVF